MELSGTLSNPFERDKTLLKGLVGLRQVLLRQAVETPREPRPAPRTAAPVLEAVTLVLERASMPMRTIEIHGAAETLLGRSLLRSSVIGILSAHTLGNAHRFTRIRRGLYQLTK
jgi:hypothetical protein